MLVMANCSLARSRVDIALLVGLGGGAPDTSTSADESNDISPARRRHHPEGVTLSGAFLPTRPGAYCRRDTHGCRNRGRGRGAHERQGHHRRPTRSRPRGAARSTWRRSAASRRRPSAGRPARDDPSRDAPRSPERGTGRGGDPARGARGIWQDHAAGPMGREGGRRVRLGRAGPGGRRPELPGPAHRSRAAGRPALGRRDTGALGTCPGTARLRPGRPAAGDRGDASPRSGRRAGARRPARDPVARVLRPRPGGDRDGRIGAPGGGGRSHPPGPGSARRRRSRVGPGRPRLLRGGDASSLRRRP